MDPCILFTQMTLSDVWLPCINTLCRQAMHGLMVPEKWNKNCYTVLFKCYEMNIGQFALVIDDKVGYKFDGLNDTGKEIQGKKYFR